MNGFIVFVIFVLVLQIALFFVIRKKRKQEKRESIIEKYDIRSPGDAFRLMQNPDIPDEDKQKIEKLYLGNDDN